MGDVIPTHRRSKKRDFWHTLYISNTTSQLKQWMSHTRINRNLSPIVNKHFTSICVAHHRKHCLGLRTVVSRHRPLVVTSSARTRYPLVSISPNSESDGKVLITWTHFKQIQPINNRQLKYKTRRLELNAQHRALYASAHFDLWPFDPAYDLCCTTDKFGKNLQIYC